MDGRERRRARGKNEHILGMELIDGTQNITASRGLLFTYMDPYGQVGVSWHHAFTPSISLDSWIFGGEDRMVDNNYSKTVGLGFTWNSGGATDKFVSLVAFRGAEQDRRDAKGLVEGAEDRQRLRLAMMGGWAWGATTLQWEGHLGREDFAAGALAGTTTAQTARWMAGGLIFRQGLVGHFGLFGRAEYVYDSSGVRLSIDPTIAASYRNQFGVDLQAISAALGLDYKEDPAFARLEIRGDQLNKDVKGLQGREYRDGLSYTLCVGLKLLTVEFKLRRVHLDFAKLRPRPLRATAARAMLGEDGNASAACNVAGGAVSHREEPQSCPIGKKSVVLSSAFAHGALVAVRSARAATPAATAPAARIHKLQVIS